MHCGEAFDVDKDIERSWQRVMIPELVGVLNKCSLPIVQFNSFRR